jgi:hypothetical protein
LRRTARAVRRIIVEVATLREETALAISVTKECELDRHRLRRVSLSGPDTYWTNDG